MLDNLAALKAQGKDLDPNEEEPLVAQWGQLVEGNARTHAMSWEARYYQI